VLRLPGFVDFERVVLALGQYKPPKDRPWEKYYIGLDDKSSVRNVMNYVFSPNVSARVKQEVELKGYKECTDEMADYILKTFGQNRRQAELQFTHTLQEDVSKKLLKQKQLNDPEKDEILAAAKVEVSKQVEMLFQCRQAHGVGIETLNAVKLLQQGGPSHAELRAIFDECDILGLGTIEHEFMPTLFQESGFQASTKMVCRIMAEHDFNEDGDVDFEEFVSICKDEQLLILYNKPSNLNAAGVPVSLQETEEGRQKGNQGSQTPGISTPLLQTEPVAPAGLVRGLVRQISPWQI